MISWDTNPATKQSAADFDWSGPVKNEIKTDDLKLWSDDEGRYSCFINIHRNYILSNFNR